MITFKIGILGAGNIAGTVADTLAKVDGIDVCAIASRDLERANAFGDAHNIDKRYGSYEELVNDDEVELVYIATANSAHAANAKLAINAGKPVLVEKPFSYDKKTTEEVLNLAKEKGVFAGEAMWIRFLPMYERLIYVLRQGVIGKVYNITCSLGYQIMHKERIRDLALGGGVLLDLGVYPINLLNMVYGGFPVNVATSCAKFETGADAQLVLQLNYAEGQSASVFLTAIYKPDNGARIYGEKGYIEVDNINNPECIRGYGADHQLLFDITPPENQITGYEYQFTTARNDIITGKKEFIAHSHKNTIDTMAFLDSIRNAAKIKFPME